MASKRSKTQAAVYHEIVRLSGELQRGFVELFKTYDLSPAQYNVLRILKGAGGEGLMCGEISDRLLHHDPDVTRLLDRLERRDLIARQRSTIDRRVVRSSITSVGLALLEQLDAPVDALHEAQLGHVSEARLQQLLTTVAAIRAGKGEGEERE